MSITTREPKRLGGQFISIVLLWHIAAPDECDGTSAVGESRHRIPGASVGQPTEPCLAVRRVFEASEEARGGRHERDRRGEAPARKC